MDGLAQQFLEHPRRAWFVWGAVAAVGLALTLPAGESLAAASDGRTALAADLAAAKAAAATVPALKARITALKERRAAAGGPQDVRGVDDDTAEALREAVKQRITAAGCRYRRLTLGSPVVTEWADGPPPILGLASGTTPARGPAAGNKVPAKFELVTRRLEAEAVGSAEQIVELLKWAASADPHAAPQEYQLSFEEDADPSARGVHLTFTLLLTAVRPAEKPAAN